MVPFVLLPNQVMGVFVSMAAGWVYDPLQPQVTAAQRDADDSRRLPGSGSVCSQREVVDDPNPDASYLYWLVHLQPHKQRDGDELVAAAAPRHSPPVCWRRPREMGHAFGGTVSATALAMVLPAGIAHLTSEQASPHYFEGFVFSCLLVVFVMVAGRRGRIFPQGRQGRTAARRSRDPPMNRRERTDEPVVWSIDETGGATMSLSEVKALTFDVFGTVVDWRGSLIRQGKELGREKGLDVDWAVFADRWRGGYGPSMGRVRRGELPWTRIDDLHRMILDDLLVEFGIDCLDEEEKRDWKQGLAQADAVARFRGRTHQVEERLRHRHAVERQRRAAHQHGQVRGPALGLHTFRRVDEALQAGPRELPGRDLPAGTRTARGGDGGRSQRATFAPPRRLA